MSTDLGGEATQISMSMPLPRAPLIGRERAIARNQILGASEDTPTCVL